MAFCAVCTRTIDGTPYREPLGRDDAPVNVCKSCSTAVVIPKENVTAHALRDQSIDDRAARIKRHRDDLYDRGLCKNGENHGARLPDRPYCAACCARYKKAQS